MAKRKISAQERALKQRLEEVEIELEDKEEENTLLRSKLNRIATVADVEDEDEDDEDDDEADDEDSDEDEDDEE